MGRPTLLSIAPELQDAIVSYATQPSVLKNICLTCKQLQSVATPKLYHSVVLDLQSPSLSTEDRGFLSVKNPGHGHVRHLRFFLADKPEYPLGRSTEESCEANMKRVLNVLPRNRLKSFTAPYRMKLEEPTFRMLCSQQQALTELSLSIPRMPSTIADQREMLQRLTSLSISLHFFEFPDTRNMDLLSVYGQLVQHAPNLRNLAINGARQGSVLGRVDLILDKLIVSSRQGQSKPLRLQTASLRGLDFRLAGEYIARVLEVENLVELRIARSAGVAELLDAAAHRFRQKMPRLQGLEFLCNDYEVCFISLQKFLRSFSGLRYFKLESLIAVNFAQFNMCSLARHAPTLTDCYVYFHLYEDDSSIYIKTNAELSHFFGLHNKLRQFAIDFPDLSDHDINSIRGMVPSHGLAIYNKYLDNMKCLPNLQILRILKVPGSYDEEVWQTMPDEHERYNTLIRLVNVLADHVVSHLVDKNGHSNLKLVCIESTEGVRCYHPRMQQDCGGRERHVAVYRDAHLVKYDFPLWDAVVQWGNSFPCDNGLGFGDYERPRIMYETRH